jgi:hypothetical protein
VLNNFVSVISRRALRAQALRELCRVTLARIASAVSADFYCDRNDYFRVTRQCWNTCGRYIMREKCEVAMYVLGWNADGEAWRVAAITARWGVTCP